MLRHSRSACLLALSLLLAEVLAQTTHTSPPGYATTEGKGVSCHLGGYRR